MAVKRRPKTDTLSGVHNYRRPAAVTNVVAINGSPADVASGAGRNVADRSAHGPIGRPLDRVSHNKSVPGRIVRH